MMPMTKKKRNILIAAIGIIVLIAGAGGGFYVLNMNKAPEDNTPPIIKQVIKLNDDIKAITIDLYNASGKLDSLSMVQSRITDIKTTIELIGRLREMVKKNQQEIDELLEFLHDHEMFFQRKNLAWIFAIQKFYSDTNVSAHHASRVNYLSSFETLLTYTYDNFDHIMEHQSQQHMKNYDVYYLRYRRAADNHNRMNRKRIAFQKQFVEQYPEVAPFIPGSHHLESFKFWDKFSF